MPRTRSVQTSFTSGELDPRLRRRTDVKHYYNGASRLRNVFIHPQGGVQLRPGLRYVAEFDEPAKLVAFQFNTEQTYLFAFINQKMRVYKDGVFQVEVVTPWTTAQLTRLNWTQSNDTMILVHPDVAPYTIVRGASHILWTVAAITFDYIPKFAWTKTTANPAFTLTPSSGDGRVTLTASGNSFLSTDVGGYVTGNGGEARLTKFISATVMEAAVTIPFINTTAIASGNWTIERGYENVWSVTRGWPNSVTFHQNRLIFGGSKSRPNTWWASRIADYYDFDPGGNLDDEAIDYTMDTDEVNEIRHVMSADHLQFFTSGAEFYVPESDVAPITPENVKCKRQDKRGIGYVPPVFVDGATQFSQVNTNLIREFLYNELEQKYNAENVTLLSSHLINVPVGMAHEPPKETRDADLVFVINTDGTWAALNTLRAQEITAWVGGSTTNGVVKSIGVDAGVTYFTVQREIDGGTVYYLERFDEDIYFDCSITKTSVGATTTWTGLGHLEGEEIHVLVDGYYDGLKTVVSGGVTSDTPGTTMDCGYAVSPHVKLLPVERELPTGTMAGEIRRVVSVLVDMNSTVGLEVNGVPVKFRRFGQGLFDGPIEAFTGAKKVRLLGFSRSPEVEFTQQYPGPFHILSAVQEVQSNG